VSGGVKAPNKTDPKNIPVEKMLRATMAIRC
jgi:hypothetical protein